MREKELQDPDRMPLLNPLQIAEDELEFWIKEYDDLDMIVEKREVLDLENRYEAKNTRMLIDVNTGEDDIVQENGDVVGAEKKKLRQKINHVQETIDILKQRKIEMNRKNEFLNAPKQAEALKEAQRKKQNQSKESNKKKQEVKAVGQELTFP